MSMEGIIILGAIALVIYYFYKKSEEKHESIKRRIKENERPGFLSNSGNITIIDTIVEQLKDIKKDKFKIIEKMRLGDCVYLCINRYNIYFQQERGDYVYGERLEPWRLYIVDFASLGKNPITENECDFFCDALRDKISQIPWLKVGHPINASYPSPAKFLISPNGKLPETFGNQDVSNTYNTKDNSSYCNNDVSNSNNDKESTSTYTPTEAQNILETYKQNQKKYTLSEDLHEALYNNTDIEIDACWANLNKKFYLERLSNEKIMSNKVRLEACLEVIKACDAYLDNPCYENAAVLDEKILTEDSQKYEFDFDEETLERINALREVHESFLIMERHVYEDSEKFRVTVVDRARVEILLELPMLNTYEYGSLKFAIVDLLRAARTFLREPSVENYLFYKDKDTDVENARENKKS